MRRHAPGRAWSPEPKSAELPRGGSRSVPEPTAKCRCLLRRAAGVCAPLRRSLDPGSVDLAVGDQRAVERKAQLTTVRVAGEHQVVAVVGEPVENSRFGRVRQAELELGDGIGCSGDGVVAIALQVRIVDAGGCDANTGHFEFAAHVVMSSHPRSVNAARRSPQGRGSPVMRLSLLKM